MECVVLLRSVLAANRLYLQHEKTNNVNVLEGVEISGDVFVHPTAAVHRGAKLGPNVSIGPNVTVKGGARIRNAIILDNVQIQVSLRDSYVPNVLMPFCRKMHAF